MLYVLDTDTVSALQRGDPRVTAQLASIAAGDVCVTIISFEEQLRGRLTELHTLASPGSRVTAYRYLQQALTFFASARVLPYDTTAARLDDELRAAFRRMGTMDRRVAAIALSYNATLVTGNLVHFRAIP